MYELMTILNMSQSPLRWLGFLQNIGRLAVVIWETFLTRNRHVERKHRKSTPSHTTYVRIGFRMFDKRLAGKDSMLPTSPKIVNKDQSVSHAVFLPFEHRHCNKGANMMKPPEHMKAARGCFASTCQNSKRTSVGPSHMLHHPVGCLPQTKDKIRKHNKINKTIKHYVNLHNTYV